MIIITGAMYAIITDMMLYHMPIVMDVFTRYVTLRNHHCHTHHHHD